MYQRLLQLVLGVLVDEFLVVCDDALCDRLSDSVDLRCVTATCDADADIDNREFVEANDEDGFVDLRRLLVHAVKTIDFIALTLKRRISGCIRERGLPLTLIRPLPFLQWATAVATSCQYRFMIDHFATDS